MQALNAGDFLLSNDKLHKQCVTIHRTFAVRDRVRELVA